jgi:ribosome recycling factor
MASYNFKNFDSRADEVVAWLTREFGGIRTGKATPTLLDLVQVESYGTRVPINQIGSVTVEDPRTLRISVWDASAVRAVEKAILEANLGISAVADGSGLRVIFPELTGERRTQLLKIAKGKLEEARVSIRAARDEATKEFDTLQKDGDMSEDERFASKEALQKRVETKNGALQKLYDLKETEISQ